MGLINRTSTTSMKGKYFREDFSFLDKKIKTRELMKEHQWKIFLDTPKEKRKYLIRDIFKL